MRGRQRFVSFRSGLEPNSGLLRSQAGHTGFQSGNFFFPSRPEREQSPQSGLRGNRFSGLVFKFAYPDLPFMHLSFANLSALSSTSPSWLQRLTRIRASKVSNTATNLLLFLPFLRYSAVLWSLSSRSFTVNSYAHSRVIP